MMRSRLFVTAIFVAVAAPTHAQQGRDESTFTWGSRLSAGSTVVIRNGNGPITVRESSTDRVEVRAEKFPRGGSSVRDVAFDVNESSGQIEICTVYGSQTSCRDRGDVRNVNVRVNYTVLMPRSSRLRVTTGNGKI